MTLKIKKDKTNGEWKMTSNAYLSLACMFSFVGLLWIIISLAGHKTERTLTSAYILNSYATNMNGIVNTYLDH